MCLITVLELRSLKLVTQSSQVTERCPPLGQARGLAVLRRARRCSGARGPSPAGALPQLRCHCCTSFSPPAPTLLAPPLGSTRFPLARTSAHTVPMS